MLAQDIYTMKPTQWKRNLEKIQRRKYGKYKEGNMENDGGVRMRRWRYETETWSKIEVRDNQGEMRWGRVYMDEYKDGVQSYSE